MTKVVPVFLILLALNAPVQRHRCKCEPASADQTTSWGTQNVTIKREEIFKRLRGRVTSGAKPLAGVLVEVYDKPEGLLMDWKEREARKSQQRKIAACVTGPDGEFCFPEIPAGKYELRCSKPVEWDPTSVYVIVAPRNRRSIDLKLDVPMHLSI